MAKNYATLGFSTASKQLQEAFGSRRSYARMEQQTITDGLTENEIEFITQRDSFYMATVGENGFPYVQHRGGPKGFLKVLDNKRLGFVDFKGNMQYITMGNLATNDKVALIMVDYPTRTRLKLFARAEIANLQTHPQLFEQLQPSAYKFVPERMLLLHVEAYDWNCPQHIVPRYTLEEIEQALAPQREKVAQLEAEIALLKKAGR